jgi:NAD(P)-dependent dehydrogenase (short-subunit alcohol dehydrogenase family)
MNKGLLKELGFLAALSAVGFLAARQKPVATALGLCAVGLQLIPGERYSFRDRSVVITGGSRGLGFALAEGFLKEGAAVSLLARDGEDLYRAQEKLESIAPGQVLTIPCDITHPAELTQSLAKAEAHWGRIDVLVNNAGSICVGPFETMDETDFDAQLDLQLRAVLQAVQEVIPAFHRVGEGRIVNITSIGGILPVPHMAPYCASKFALAGLSETLAAELAADNIRVTTVYPGLMRTGSPIQAVFKGDHEREYGWFAASDVMPGLSVSARSAVRKIIDGVRRGDAQVSYPTITKIGIIGHAIFPELYALFNREAARRLPKGTSRLRKTGAESQGWLESQAWYRPLKHVEHRAEKQWNQLERSDANFNLGVGESV